MKKLNYDDAKICELLSWLEGNYEHEKLADCIEVRVDYTGRRILIKLLTALNESIKSPPLGLQYCPEEGVATIFDQR